MNKIDGLWEDVQVGFYVQDKTGKWWRVEGFDLNGEPQLIDDADKQVTIAVQPGERPVRFMYDPKTLIQQKLDGKEIR